MNLRLVLMPSLLRVKLLYKLPSVTKVSLHVLNLHRIEGKCVHITVTWFSEWESGFLSIASY